MSDCDHDDLDLGRKFDERVMGDRGLPRQVSFEAQCTSCGETVTVDYNIAFIDGDSA